MLSHSEGEFRVIFYQIFVTLRENNVFWLSNMHSSGHFYQTWDLLGFMVMYYKRVKFIAILGGFPDSSVGKESAGNVGDLGLIPGLGRSPGEAKGYPLQYFGSSTPVLYGTTEALSSQSNTEKEEQSWRIP